MADNSQDRIPSWANRLEELEQVPGESAFDRSAAWQQLQGRLDRAPAGKRRFPYWMVAAALILLALGFYWWPVKKTLPGNIVKTPALAPLLTGTLPARPPATNQATILRKSVKKSVRLTTAKSPENLLPAQLPQVTAPLVSTPPVSDPGNPAEESLAAVPIPKKLNQVHLNELPGDPASLANDTRKPYPRRMIRRLNNLNDESLVNAAPTQIRININTPN